MLTTNLQKAPYLREQRQFPQDSLSHLASETDQAYIDIAGKVNERIIGSYALNSAMITGERWFLQGGNQRQQSLRSLYNFTSTAVPIAHGLDFSTITLISPQSFGSFTDGTNWYGLNFASNIAIPGQITFYLTPTNIIFLIGAGSPALTNGYIILSWVSQF